MGFCIVAGKDIEGKKGYKQVNDFYYKVVSQDTPSPLFWEISSHSLLFAIGDVFNCSLSDLNKKAWEEDDDPFNNILGEFSLVKVDLTQNKVFFASSKTGIENLYYYSSKNIFLITNSFWEAINILEPEREDIDEQALWESLIYPYPLINSTIIKELKWLKPASKGEWSSESKLIRCSKYWCFKYKVDNDVTLDKAVDRVDKILDQSMKLIKEKCGDIQYAVGLSGGLDSRIIPYYALKNNMKLKSFIIAEKNPKTPLVSRDYQSARKLAKYYNIKLYEISTTQDSIKTQYENDIKIYPLGPSAIGKLVLTGLPEFDILLTGGSGLIMGSELPASINSMSNEDLFNAIKNHSSNIKDKPIFLDRFSRAMDYLFNIKIKIEKNSDEMIPRQVLSTIREKWMEFIEVRKDLGYTNVDIYEDYFNNYLGYRNRLGSFESIRGTKRSFSIYIPFLFQESLTWDLYLLEDRKLLKEVVLRKIPEVANIKMQSYHVDMTRELSNKMIKKINKIVVMAGFLLRGSGTGVIKGYKNKSSLKKLIENILNSNTKWFNSIIDKDVLRLIIKNNDYKNNYAYLIAKRKSVVDIIEKKEYEKFGL